jgi:hypothetical protein
MGHWRDDSGVGRPCQGRNGWTCDRGSGQVPHFRKKPPVCCTVQARSSRGLLPSILWWACLCLIIPLLRISCQKESTEFNSKEEGAPTHQENRSRSALGWGLEGRNLSEPSTGYAKNLTLSPALPPLYKTINTYRSYPLICYNA